MALWPLLAPVPGDRLIKARLQLQNAATLLVQAHAPPPVSAALGWRPRDSSIHAEGNGPGGGGVGLRIRDLTFVLPEPSDGDDTGFPLHGKTGAQALAWLSGAKQPDGGTAASGAAGAGGADQLFDGSDAEAFEALASWFEAGFRVAAGARRADTETTGVLIDLGDLTIARHNSLSSSSSIATGMTPGDSGQLLPYFHVRPVPPLSSPGSAPPPVPGAEWTGGGAILGAELVWSWGSAEEQEERTLEFVDKAYVACCDLLGEEP